MNSKGAMPRMLEVCCGTAQVSRYFAAQGYEVVTVDWEAKWAPTIRADVRTLRPERLWSPGWFDVIWASPDCTEFSLAKSTAPRDFAKGDSIVIACFDIIRYLTTNTEKQVFWAMGKSVHRILTQAGAYAPMGFVPKASGLL